MLPLASELNDLVGAVDMVIGQVFVVGVPPPLTAVTDTVFKLAANVGLPANVFDGLTLAVTPTVSLRVIVSVAFGLVAWV